MRTVQRRAVVFGALLAGFALAGCQAKEPLTFQFKWYEDEAGYKWLADCAGEHPPGTNVKGRIEIVDRATAKRLAQRGPNAELEEEDLAGLRCIPPEEIDGGSTESATQSVAPAP